VAFRYYIKEWDYLTIWKEVQFSYLHSFYW
jgi:hypothetical protein